MAEDVGSLVVKVGMDSNLFQQGVSELNKKMALLKSEFSATSTQLKNFGSATDQLKNKSDFLSRGVEIQQAKIKALAQAYEKSKTETGENSKATQELGIKLNRAQVDLAKMQGELKRTTQELETQSSKWTKLSKSMETVSTKLKSVGEKMSTIGKSLTMSVTAPIVAAGAASIKLASDLAESTNKVDVVFGSNANKVKEWSSTTLKSFGIAKVTSLDMASTFGDMATSMGLNVDQSSKMSMSLVGLAGDLSSFKNIGIGEATTALNGIFTGETESLKQLGIVMTQANLQQFAYNQGIKTNIQDMSQAEQTQLRYNYILSVTKNAQGDFARTGGGTANQIRIFHESMKELGSTIGEKLLPLFTPIIQKLNEWIIKFSQLSDGTQKTIITIAGIAAVIGPAILVIGQLVSAFGAISGALAPVLAGLGGAGGATGLSGALAALTGPVGIAIAAIIGLIAIFVAAYKNSEEFRNKVNTVFTQVKEIISGIIENLKIIFNVFVQVATQIWQKHGDDIMRIVNLAFTFIANVITTILNVISNVIKVVTGIISGDWSKVWEGVKGVASSVWNGIGSIISSAINLIKSVISTGLQIAFTIVQNVFNNIKEAIMTPIRAAANFVNEQIERIKSVISSIKGAISNMFTGIKIPSISVGVKWGGPDDKIPYPSFNVKWYAKGGIFSGPSVIGVGEAGREAVLPIDRLDELMAKAIAKVGGVGNGGAQTIIIPVNLNGKEIARVITPDVNKELGNLNRKNLAWR